MKITTHTPEAANGKLVYFREFQLDETGSTEEITDEMHIAMCRLGLRSKVLPVKMADILADIKTARKNQDFMLGQIQSKLAEAK